MFIDRKCFHSSYGSVGIIIHNGLCYQRTIQLHWQPTPRPGVKKMQHQQTGYLLPSVANAKLTQQLPSHLTDKSYITVMQELQTSNLLLKHLDIASILLSPVASCQGN